MENIIEEELSLLREILSNLVLEETHLIRGDISIIGEIMEKQQVLRRNLLKITQKRTKNIPKNVAEDNISLLTSFKQIDSLKEKIAKQEKSNAFLRKKQKLQGPLFFAPEEELPAPNKPHLLLEEDSN